MSLGGGCSEGQEKQGSRGAPHSQSRCCFWPRRARGLDSAWPCCKYKVGTTGDVASRGAEGQARMGEALLGLLVLPPAACSWAVLQMFTGVFPAQVFSSLGLSWFRSSGPQASQPPTSAILGRVAGGQCLTTAGLAPGGQRPALPREPGQGISCPDGLGAALLLPLSASVSPSVNAPSEGSCGASERSLATLRAATFLESDKFCKGTSSLLPRPSHLWFKFRFSCSSIFKKQPWRPCRACRELSDTPREGADVAHQPLTVPNWRAWWGRWRPWRHPWSGGRWSCSWKTGEASVLTPMVSPGCTLESGPPMR